MDGDGDGLIAFVEFQRGMLTCEWKSVLGAFTLHRLFFGYVQDETWENQLWVPVIGWHANGAPFAWSSEDNITERIKESICCPINYPGRHWQYVNDWHIDQQIGGGKDGWLYADDFKGNRTWSAEPKGSTDVCRRRRWLRHRLCEQHWQASLSPDDQQARDAVRKAKADGMV